MITETLYAARDLSFQGAAEFFLNRGVETLTPFGYDALNVVFWLTIIASGLLVFGLASSDGGKDKQEVTLLFLGAALGGAALEFVLLYAELYLFATGAWIFVLAGLLLTTGIRFRHRWLPYFYRLRAWLSRNKPVQEYPTSEMLTSEMKEDNETKTIQTLPTAPKKPVAPPVHVMRNRAIDELNSMIGLESVKKQVHTMAALAKAQRQRKMLGLPTAPITLHVILTGNPGTGKTTVARIIADVYREAGLLSRGQLCEKDGRGLIGKYIGHTAILVRKIVEKEAMDGVLFIDEIQALVPEDSTRDFGPEAVHTLNKLMDEYRDRFVVIFAGYEDEIDRVLNVNMGMWSRFQNRINFPDYTAEELHQIFEKTCSDNGLLLTADARVHAQRLFSEMHATRKTHFGNGRAVRNTFERCIMNQAQRLSSKNAPSRQELQTLTVWDLPNSQT